MPRQNLIEREFDKLARGIARKLENSPLAFVSQPLLDLIISSRASVFAGSMTNANARSVITSITTMLDALPNSFGARFMFDAALIQSLTEEWSAGGTQLSSVIVPRHSKEWGHLTVPMPSSDRLSTHVVDVILFPADDDLLAIDLLDYPWLGHEMGHNMHFRADYFVHRFRPRLEERLTAIQALSIADRGTAKQKSIASINMIRDVWTPTRDHKNWAHEIAVDVVALWTCGPAFLFAFDDLLDRHVPSPFHIGKVHPPYHLRALALADAASRLGWSEYMTPIQERIDGWNKSVPTAYEYSLLFDDELLVATVSCGLLACEDFGLPRFTKQHKEEIESKVRSGSLPEFGSELIIAAWLVEQEMIEQDFQEWHDRVIEELAASVMLESQQ